MSAVQGGNMAAGRKCSPWNSGRARGENRLVARVQSSSRLPRARVLKQRVRRFGQGPEERAGEDYLVALGKRDVTHRHREGDYPCLKERVRVVPTLLKALVVAFVLLSAKGHQPGTATSGGSVQQPWAALGYTMHIVALVWAARLLPGMKFARQAAEGEKRPNFKDILGAALLVAGGTVGAGIVALPVKTASVGLLPSAAGLIGGWGYMLLAAFQIVDITKYCGAGANFTSMAGSTLGKRWKAVSGALYIFVYCATLTAYIAESATFTGAPLAQVLGYALPPATLSILFTAVFGGAIGLGPKVVDRVNSTCVLVALTAFGVLMWMGGTGLRAKSLLYSNWGSAAQTAPIMIVAFTYHNMIPSLFQHLKSAAAVKVALGIGTLIPLAMYLAWEVLILGSLPPGTRLGSVGEVVQLMGGTGAVPIAINTFSLFAIVTSFLGVGMGCIDFAQDLIRVPREGSSKEEQSWLAVVATLAVPLGVACLCPELFVAALEISGMLRLILFAVIPGMMLRAGPLRHSGGKQVWVAGVVGVIAVGIIGIDVVGRLAPVLYQQI